MTAPRYLSLFSGAGGLDHGLDNAGWQCAGQCEIDDTARSVLARHWPGVPRWTDVRDVAHPDVDGGRGPLAGAGRVTSSDREGSDARPAWGDVDLIAGGFPCQDVSVAGRRAGLAGERSGLWWEFHRILDAVRPRAALLENVEGLLSSNGGRDMGAIIEALVDLGYGWAYRVLDAQHFGVPQRRRRVFLLAILGGDPGAERAAQVLALTPGGGGDPPARPGTRTGTPRDAGGGVADTLRSHPRPGSNSYGAIVVGALAGRSASRLDDACAGGGQLVPTTVIANALDRMAGGPDDNSAQANHLVTHALTRSSAKGASEDGTGRGTPLAPTDQGVRRLTPRECERLMGWPETEETYTLSVWNGPVKNHAPAERQSLRRPRRASRAGNAAINESAWSAAERLSAERPPHGGHAVVSVATSSEDGHTAIVLPATRWSRHVSGAEMSSAYGNLGLPADSALINARLLAALASATHDGGEVSLPRPLPSTPPWHGTAPNARSGHATAERANAAVNAAVTASDLLRFITSGAGPSSRNFALLTTTLLSCVVHATSGFIPGGTLSASSYDFALTLRSCHTRFRADGAEIADARRYAMCGNGVVAPVAEWIGARLARELAREDIEITSAA